MGSDNGATGSKVPDGVQRIVISYSAEQKKFDLDLGGMALDDALSLLDRTHRELDARYRFGRARELAAEAMSEMQTQQLVRSVMRGSRIKA